MKHMPSGIFKRTKKHSRNISKSLMGNKNRLGYFFNHTEETKQKIREHNLNTGKIPPSRKGIKYSNEIKKRMSDGMKKRWLSLSKEEKWLVIKNNYSRGKFGKLSTGWKGGLSLRGYGIGFNKELKEQILKRDLYYCQFCGIIQECLNYKLHIHHIDYDKKNNNKSNLISLCSSCHLKTNGKRSYWTKHFCENKVSNVPSEI